MLTIRRSLITPFILGSLSVGQNNSDSSFVYGFMSLDYGLGTITATTLIIFFLIFVVVCDHHHNSDNVATVCGWLVG